MSKPKLPKFDMTIDVLWDEVHFHGIGLKYITDPRYTARNTWLRKTVKGISDYYDWKWAEGEDVHVTLPPLPHETALSFLHAPFILEDPYALVQYGRNDHIPDVDEEGYPTGGPYGFGGSPERVRDLIRLAGCTVSISDIGYVTKLVKVGPHPYV